MKLFKNMGIVAIFLFSFFYTEKIANLTLEKNEMYQSIKKESINYEIKAVNAIVDGNFVTPGLNGKKVSLKDSYYNMKELNVFNDKYLIFDTTYPEQSILKYKDKVINNGNNLKRSISFILEYNKPIIDYFNNYNIDASILVDMNTFNKDEKLEQINNEVRNFKNLDSLLNKYNINTNICYINDLNEGICRSNRKYLVNSNLKVNNVNFKNIRNDIQSGDIIYVEKNMDVKSMQLLINSITYKDLDIIRLSKLLSEERD